MYLETNRLKLKSIGFDDRGFILNHFSKDDINEYLYDEDPPKNLEEADDLVKSYLKSSSDYLSRWILILKSNNKKIGTCGFHKHNKSDKSIEIGYDIQKLYWGNGYMKEALHHLLDYAQRHMDVKTIKACIYFYNINSIRFANKLGFVKTDITEVLDYKGEQYLHYYYELSLDN